MASYCASLHTLKKRNPTPHMTSSIFLKQDNNIFHTLYVAKPNSSPQKYVFSLNLTIFSKMLRSDGFCLDYSKGGIYLLGSHGSLMVTRHLSHQTQLYFPLLNFHLSTPQASKETPHQLNRDASQKNTISTFGHHFRSQLTQHWLSD